ncbi:hypothetical protein [Paenibacillus paridis]|uniref:hypothetical protein n=1 Tax=Paenibacillus paridis TaxID=2583376 RepID=UPI00111E71C6|nr:hypothetical protein [Paenibacillus paridis]
MDNEPKNDFNNSSVNEPYAPRPIFSNENSDILVVKKHSGLGIAAFIIGLICVVIVIIGGVTGSSLVDQLANSDLIITDPNDTQAIQESIEALGEDALIAMSLTLLCLVGAGMLAFVGLILAIIAACSSKRRKMFGVIGILVNVLVIVAGISLFFSGIASIASSVA